MDRSVSKIAEEKKHVIPLVKMELKIRLAAYWSEVKHCPHNREETQ